MRVNVCVSVCVFVSCNVCVYVRVWVSLCLRVCVSMSLCLCHVSVSLCLCLGTPLLHGFADARNAANRECVQVVEAPLACGWHVELPVRLDLEAIGVVVLVIWSKYLLLSK